MPSGLVAILDPAAGVSGDMLLGALIDAGVPVDWLHELPGRLGLDGVTVETTTVDRCGIRATKVTVRSPDGAVEEPGDVPEGSHGVHATGEHTAAHPHRHVSTLLKVVDSAPLSARTRELARRAFELIADAEARVHGIPAERVALHEVGATDALVDIVGAVEGFERLGVSAVYSRPVAVGNGWVRSAHGQLPVPAPATAILLEGLAVVSGGPVRGEATTPTGAALLRVLSAGAPPTRWRPVRTAWGAGTRNPEGYPNALRLMLAEPAPEAAEVTLLATDLDDLSPEYLEPLREAVVAAGALDVQVWATQMKKGRIGFRLEAQVPPDREDEVAEAIFTHSTTLGIRRWSAERRTLERREWTLERNAGGRIRVKTVEGPNGPRTKPEFDDVLSEARRTGRPAHDVARELTAQAERRTRPREAPGVTAAPKELE
ncbi:MAG: nickel pincer cofactor biosynthesis protein LarC [Gemmatimonadales bacterium]